MDLLPTAEAYGELQQAADYFNDRLFAGELPPCLITLQREKRTYGYFSRKRFVRRSGEATDEIALNPQYFAAVPLTEVLQTLVHEQCHQWQAHFGKPSRKSYHNREWAGKMEDVGLMPSDTGQPGGKKVGQKMMDYVIDGGPFDLACRELLATGFTVSWLDRILARETRHGTVTLGRPGAGGETEDPNDPGEENDPVLSLLELPPENRSNRHTYQCPNFKDCKQQAWGKPGLLLGCFKCEDAPRLVDVTRSPARAAGQ